MFDIETWSVIERHLQRFPAGEFRDLLASGDFDVHWPLTFAAWYKQASGVSVNQACVDFLSSANLWDEALKGEVHDDR